MTSDPVLINEWHPVAFAEGVAVGVPYPVSLLDEELVLWRRANGALQAWDDQCPHRGAKLSLGCVIADQLVCPYHGWRFDGDGRCTLRPAQPGGPLPAARMTRGFHVAERHGVVWVCLGTPASEVVPYAEFADPMLRNVTAGPYPVAACAPRIVENFIDMAHFSFVHEGILGTAEATGVPDYQVESFVDASGAPGVRTVGIRVHQPRANLQASAPADVDYSYRISRPLSAILTKRIVGADVTEAIALFIQPQSEEQSVVWMIFSGVKSAEPDEVVRAFQDTVFAQDRPILESQRPKRLPLQTRAEHAQKADALSAAYRRYLRAIGLTCGVTT